jgi:hypothetical protein
MTGYIYRKIIFLATATCNKNGQQQDAQNSAEL